MGDRKEKTLGVRYIPDVVLACPFCGRFVHTKENPRSGFDRAFLLRFGGMGITRRYVCWGKGALVEVELERFDEVWILKRYRYINPQMVDDRYLHLGLREAGGKPDHSDEEHPMSEAEYHILRNLGFEILDSRVGTFTTARP